MELGLRLNLLGGFELTVCRRPVPVAQASQRLISFLALQTRPVMRQYVAGALWPYAFIRLSTDRAPKEAPVTITGSGYCPRHLIDIRVDVSNAGSVTTDGSGGFVRTITVPSTAPSSGFPAAVTAESRARRGSTSRPLTIG